MLEFVFIEGSPNSYSVISTKHRFIFTLSLIMKAFNAATPELLIC
jgi:hypothetical protein